MCPSDKFQDLGVSGTNFGKAAAHYRDILYMTSYARFREADILFDSETGRSRLIVRYHFCRPITSKVVSHKQDRNPIRSESKHIKVRGQEAPNSFIEDNQVRTKRAD